MKEPAFRGSSKESRHYRRELGRGKETGPKRNCSGHAGSAKVNVFCTSFQNIGAGDPKSTDEGEGHWFRGQGRWLHFRTSQWEER